LRKLQRLKFSNGISTNSLAYADDLLLLVKEKEEMRKMLKVIEEWCVKNSMVVNTKAEKSAIMPVGRNANRDLEFQIDGKNLHITRKYKYIGFLLTSNGSWCQHISTKTSKAQGLLVANARFLTDRTIPVKIRLEVGQALIISQLRYGENVISIGKHLAQKAESIQTGMHRMILDMPRPWPAKDADETHTSLQAVRERASIKYRQRVNNMPVQARETSVRPRTNELI
jgi:hypothetical protein